MDAPQQLAHRILGASPTPELDIRSSASAAAAGLRIVDGVRMLGPSLAKLSEFVAVAPGGSSSARFVSPTESTIASALCISLHRSTVKNCSKTLENLARSIQNDPLDGLKHRPRSDVVHAIRQLNYQGNNTLSLESGRLLKSRFSGFIEDFEKVYIVHRNFTVDPKLRQIKIVCDAIKQVVK